MSEYTTGPYQEPMTVEYWRQQLEQRIEEVKEGVVYFDTSQPTTAQIIDRLIEAARLSGDQEG